MATYIKHVTKFLDAVRFINTVKAQNFYSV